jgi:phospholipase/carboxylesterase
VSSTACRAPPALLAVDLRWSPVDETRSDGRLRFRPRPSGGAFAPVDGPLGLEVVRDGVLYVPETAEAAGPLMVLLHGAGGSGRRELRAVVAAADRYGATVVAPDSRGITWDIFSGGFGPDVDFIDRVLDAVADRCDADLSRLALGGISDGATYALSLGLTNGDVFGAIVAFSPGGVASGRLTGTPRVYVSHGTHDPVLPIDGSSRTLVPMLRTGGYDVTYHEFDGGHTVPPTIADEAFAWWLRESGPPV